MALTTSSSGSTTCRSSKSQRAKIKHFCPICERGFSTGGHLARHNLVHTGEKRHQCPFPGCQTVCSRRDNLLQHYRIHIMKGHRKSSSGLDPLEPEVFPKAERFSPPLLSCLPTMERAGYRIPTPPNTPPPLAPAYYYVSSDSGSSSSSNERHSAPPPDSPSAPVYPYSGAGTPLVSSPETSFYSPTIASSYKGSPTIASGYQIKYEDDNEFAIRAHTVEPPRVISYDYSLAQHSPNIPQNSDYEGYHISTEPEYYHSSVPQAPYPAATVASPVQSPSVPVYSEIYGDAQVPIARSYRQYQTHYSY